MNTKQNTTLSAGTLRSYQSVLLHNVRLRTPEIGFAARFLPKYQRPAVLSVVGLTLLLSDILHPIPSTETASHQEAVSNTTANGDTGGETDEKAGRNAGGNAGGEPARPDDMGGGGCSYGNDGLTVRRIIAQRIITYLYHEAVPGEIGRAEIELYLPVKDAYPVTEKAWLALIEELTDYYEPKRFATRRALYARMDAIVEAVLELIGPIVFSRDTGWDGENGESNASAVRSGLIRLGRGVMLTQVLRSLPLEWEGGRRLLVPLDILGEFGLRDSDFTFISEGTLSGRVVQSVADDAASFFTQGAEVFSAIDGLTGRSVLLFGLQWKMMLKRVQEAYAKVSTHHTGINWVDGTEFDVIVSLRTRDRYRLLLPALMLDSRLLNEGLSV